MSHGITKFQMLAISMKCLLDAFPSKPCFPYDEQEFDCDPEEPDSPCYLKPSDYNNIIHSPEFLEAIEELHGLLIDLAKEAILSRSDELSLEHLGMATYSADKAIDGLFGALRYLLRTTS